MTALSTSTGYLASATSAELIHRSRRGDEDASEVLYRRYVNRLTRLANRHLNDKYQTRIPSDDVVQSIFRTVWRVTGKGSDADFQFADETGFWRWLVTIGLNKIYKKISEANAAKRAVDREVAGDFDNFSRQVAERTPLPNHAVEVADLFETILSILDPMEQQILHYRLAGYSQREIADKLDVHTRTIRRRMYNIREQTSRILGTEMPPQLD